MKKLIYLTFILMAFNLNAQEICNDQMDNDFDQLIDCVDPDCYHPKVCKNFPCYDESIFYQVINGDKLVKYDPSIGGYEEINTNTGNPINAIGYNVQDGFIYGISGNTNRLIKVGANGVFEEAYPGFDIAGLPTNQTYYIGDCDLNGFLYVVSSSSHTVYKINISINTALTLTSNDNTNLTEFNFSDFSFLPATGLLYGLTDESELISIHTFTGEYNLVHDFSSEINCGGTFGASFADNNGLLYFFCNDNGVMYQVDVNQDTPTITLFDNTEYGGTSGHDGAACALPKNCFNHIGFEADQLECNTYAFNPTVFAGTDITVVNYFWNFGDGTTSMDENPNHIYENNGSYTVSLTVTGINTVTGECCCETISTEVEVLCVCELNTTFDFIEHDCNTFEFTALATPNGVTTLYGYLWEFGDGTTSIEQNPTHDYTTDGVYEVTLTVAGLMVGTDECCCDAQSYSVLVNCSPPSSPYDKTRFSITPNPAVNNVTVLFESESFMDREMLSLRFVSSNGSIAKQTEIKNNAEQIIDLSDLTNGTYTVSVYNQNENLATEKLVVQKVN